MWNGAQPRGRRTSTQICIEARGPGSCRSAQLVPLRGRAGAEHLNLGVFVGFTEGVWKGQLVAVRSTV